MPGTTIEPSQGSHDTLGDHIKDQVKNAPSLPSAPTIVIVVLVLIALLWVAKS
jgi:hypothetical protein